MEQPLEEKYLLTGRKPRILVAPLDWGLGHATRCIPIIRELLSRDCEVWLAGEGSTATLLQLEFPSLPLLPLPGYRIKYGKSRPGLFLRMIGQSRKILKSIREERAWLNEKMGEHSFDAVISDNRYGLSHQAIPCIFMTHQLRIKARLGNWLEKILQKRNYGYINQFTTCWVPDMEGENNLAGELSHPKSKPAIPVIYTGPLSRFHRSGQLPRKDHLLVVLSGPEPQRSILENRIAREISNYPGTSTIVRGLPGENSIIPSSDSIRFYNHLGTDQLNAEMEDAEFVICRSGYSSIMDIVRLQKKSILVPTPGQPEQEYLANYLSDKQIACKLPQRQFSLALALEKAREFSYSHLPATEQQLLEAAVSKLVNGLGKG